MAAVMKGVDDTIQKCRELNKFISEGYSVTKTIAEEFQEDENAKQIVEDLRQVMLNYATMERGVEQYCTAAQTALGRFKTTYAAASGDNEEEVPDLYGMFEESLKGLEAKNTEDEIANNKEVKEFMETVWRAHNPEEEAESTENAIGDDEVEISQVDDNMRFICPITKVELVDPVKNKRCGHTYSRKAIEQHIKAMKTRAKCPIPGCVSADVITSGDLEANNVLAFELRQRNKKM